MNRLNLSDNIIRLRHERKLTQEELAEFMGVTKASVSKWEKGVNTPDLLLLPQLAAYFDVTIDELIGYEAQLSGEQIRRQYAELDKDFAVCPFEDIAPGDLYAFIGHNGAGKTTTLKCVAGIQDFDSGSIWIGGKDIRKEPIACKRQFAYIPDNPDLYEYLTGIQYLNFIADLFGVAADKRGERIAKYGDAFEITESLGDLISTYSHGMKQKLAILSALVHRPKLLLLDEPFVGLDPKAALILKDIIYNLDCFPGC